MKALTFIYLPSCGAVFLSQKGGFFVALHHGDVVVWGGPSRLAWHGILTLKPGEHPATGAVRLNLTFRQAGQR